jgi:hypothetical protein
MFGKILIFFIFYFLLFVLYKYKEKNLHNSHILIFIKDILNLYITFFPFTSKFYNHLSFFYFDFIILYFIYSEIKCSNILK